VGVRHQHGIERIKERRAQNWETLFIELIREAVEARRLGRRRSLYLLLQFTQLERGLQGLRLKGL
jgi:hypothetical protein